jgi:hypothetical protein
LVIDPSGQTGRAASNAIVEVKECDVGLGVFVRRDVPAGSRLLTFTGKPIDFADTIAKGEREGDALQIGVDLYLDLEPPGCYVNHSCDPNAAIRDCTRLVALRDLRAGDEVRFDYSTTMSESHWTLDCRCGAPGCRGVVRDFRWLPQARKLALIGMHAVSAFLVAEELDSGRLTFEQVRRASTRSGRRATGAAAPTPLRPIPSDGSRRLRR